MKTLARILAATDFSPRSTVAVDRAARLAHEHKATLYLVHVVDHLLLRMFAGDVDDHPLATEQRLLQSARERLSALSKLLASHFAITVEPVVRAGRVHVEIAHCAAEHAIDLSVLGAHGENFVRDAFLGSTASRYVRRSRHPTLVARSDDQQPYQSVLVGVDFSAASGPAVQAAIAVAPKAAVRLLHVCEQPYASRLPVIGIGKQELAARRAAQEKQARVQLEAFARDIPGAAALTRVVQSGPAAKTIVRHARAQRCDLLVVGRRGAFELDPLLLGSVSLRLLEQFDRDLLLVAPGDGQE